MKTETRTLWVKLTETERNERARRAAEALALWEQADSKAKFEAKILKNEVEKHQKACADLSRTAREGTELQPVSCHWVPDIVESKMRLVRDDTGDDVEVRNMTTEERQLSLPTIDASSRRRTPRATEGGD